MEASFSKSFRGYDVSEVDAYVQSVQNQETESQNALAKLNQKTAELEVEVARLREIESSLFRALKLAEESQQNFEAFDTLITFRYLDAMAHNNICTIFFLNYYIKIKVSQW